MSSLEELTAEQRQRLAVLHCVRDVALVELDAFDLIRCAHWVHSGEELPVSGTSELDHQDIIQAIRKEIRIRGGDVQTVIGR